MNANFTSAEGLKSTSTFELMNEYCKVDGASIVKKLDAVYNFEILKTKGGPVAVCWKIDLKNGNGSVTQGRAADAAATFTMVDEDYFALTEGKLNPQMAFLQVNIM